MNVFTKIDRENIRDSARFVFSCNAWTASSKNESKARKAKRNIVDRTVSTALNVMESEKPPQSRDESIRRTIKSMYPRSQWLIAVLSIVIAKMFPQYALAIRIAGWVWDYLHLETAGDK
jgi:hypothetical protein